MVLCLAISRGNPAARRAGLPSLLLARGGSRGTVGNEVDTTDEMSQISPLSLGRWCRLLSHPELSIRRRRPLLRRKRGLQRGQKLLLVSEQYLRANQRASCPSRWPPARPLSSFWTAGFDFVQKRSLATGDVLSNVVRTVATACVSSTLEGCGGQPALPKQPEQYDV